MIFTRKMKKLLITSAVLAFIAVVLCLVGFFMAKSGNDQLFSQTQNEDGNYVHIHEFDAASIKKISVEVAYTDVNIIGGAANNFIELVNFPADQFTLMVGATTIAIEEKSGLSELFRLNFSGFRNYFTSAQMASKSKTVNIYLTDESVMKLLDIDVYSGNVDITGVMLDTDFDIKLDYGSLTAEDVVSSGELKTEIAEGNVDVKNSSVYTHTCSLTLGYECLIDSTFTELDTDITMGYFKYETGGDSLLSGVLRLKTDNGRVRFGGDIYEGGSFSQGMEYTGVSGVVQTVIDVKIGEGNIMITE